MRGAREAYPMPAIGPAPPLDIGCGTLVPARSSNLCAVYTYDHNDDCAPNLVEDKPFEMHVLVQTTRGRWDFHGHAGVQDVDTSLVVVGVHGEHYGCRHDRRYGDSNIIASFRPSALDEDDEPPFAKQTIPIDTTLPLRRAIAAESTDDFDSRVFEIFDAVATLSLRDGRPRRSHRLRMQRAKRFIEDHASENITLADIAASVRLSPFVCLRQFKAHNGMTPHVYLSSLRLRRAQQLLKRPDMPIGAVSTSIGMTDRCYFARWFSKSTGVSPTQFRRSFE